MTPEDDLTATCQHIVNDLLESLAALGSAKHAHGAERSRLLADARMAASAAMHAAAEYHRLVAEVAP